MKAICIRGAVVVASALGFAASTAAQAVNGCGVSASTQVRLRQVAEHALKNPISTPLPDRLVQAFGLGGTTFVQKQALIRNTNGIHTQVFVADANGSGKYLIYRRGGGPTEIFLTDSGFTPLSAVSYEHGALSKLNIADSGVCSRYQAEVGVWAEANLEHDAN